MLKTALGAVLAALLCAGAVGGPGATDAGGARTLYSCDFEQGTGIFTLVAKGEAFAASLDDASAHGGRQSVRLFDPGGADADLTWRHEWDDRPGRDRGAFVHWARDGRSGRSFELRQGHTYEVRAYVRTEEAHGLGIRATVWAAEGLPVRGQPERYSPIVRGTRDWGWLSARIACTSGDGELAEITIALLGRGTAWVDDVHVLEYEEEDSPSINYGVYPPVRLEDVRVGTASCIALEFIGDLHYLKAEEPENWLVESDEDAAFADGLRPEKVGRMKVLDNPDGKLYWADTYRHTIFLVLPRALQSGKRYRVVMTNVGVERGEFEILFDDRANLSRSIKANQYGYLPDALKYAYLGGWLGSAGPLALGAYADEFHVVDAATGQVVFSGKPELRMSHDRHESLSTSALGNLTGEDTYELDFSRFATPGTYFVFVPGVGRSLPFRIASDVYAEPFYHCARALLHQRCGIELKEPWSKFPRAACHRSPGVQINATIVEHGSEDQDRLVEEDPGIKTETRLDAWGGYHDAADYDRLVGHYRIPASLLILYEMFPTAFPDRQLGLPESGDGLPDIVDEALWQVEFGIRMQDPQDGGVRGGAGPNAVVTAPPDLDANPIYVYGEDPITGLSLAGVAAQAARVLEGLGRHERAARYLERAQAAWSYGLGNGGEKFPIPHAFAALELFKATGEPAYHQAFLTQVGPLTEADALAQARHMGLFVWNVWMSYLMWDDEAVDDGVREAFRQRVIGAAEKEIENMQSYAYRMPNWIPSPVRYGWGCGTNFPGGEFLVMAWYVTGEQRYRDYALLAADFSLGCHPTGTVFITGLGQRHVKWALHPFSDPLAAHVNAPVEGVLPGIPLFGVHAYPPSFSGWQSQLLYIYADPSRGVDNYYPPASQWPDLRLFADVGWVPILSEYSVSSTMLHTTFLYGALLAAGGESAPPAQ